MQQNTGSGPLWLVSMVAALAEITEETILAMPEIDEPVGKKESVVGVLDFDLLKLLYLRGQCKEKITVIYEAMSPCAAQECFSEKNEPSRGQIIILAAEHEALDQIFWVSLRTRFPELTGKDKIGVREGWKVVWSEDITDAIFGLIKQVMNVCR